MFFQFFSAISEVIVSETQYILSEWLHTAYQMVFNQKYSNFKIRSIFRVYLENSPVNTFDQPHGSDQCGQWLHTPFTWVKFDGDRGQGGEPLQTGVDDASCPLGLHWMYKTENRPWTYIGQDIEIICNQDVKSFVSITFKAE